MFSYSPALSCLHNVLTVSIEVVEDGHASLLLTALLDLLPVVRLGPPSTPSVGPVSELERMT